MQEWEILIQGQRYVADTETIRGWILEQRVKKFDQMRRNAHENWTTADRFPEFQEAFSRLLSANLPPPLQPPPNVGFAFSQPAPGQMQPVYPPSPPTASYPPWPYVQPDPRNQPYPPPVPFPPTSAQVPTNPGTFLPGPPMAARDANAPLPASPWRTWRNGQQLICVKGAILPPYCVKCNAPRDFSIRKRFVWVKGGTGWTLFGLAINVIIAMFAVLTSRKNVVELGLCKTHFFLGLGSKLLAWGFGIAAGVNTYGVIKGWHTVIQYSALLLFASLVFIVAGRLFSIRVVKVDDSKMWLEGFDPTFQNRFPHINL